MLEVKPPPGWQPDVPAGDRAPADENNQGAARGSSGELASTVDDPIEPGAGTLASGAAEASDAGDLSAAAPEAPARRSTLWIGWGAVALLILSIVGMAIWWLRGEGRTTANVQPTPGEQAEAAPDSNVVDQQILPADDSTTHFESAIDWTSADPVLALLPAEIGYLTDLPAWVSWRRDRRLVETRIARLGAGLAEFVAAEQSFPVLAAGSNTLPADSRLSCVASVLPFYGHADWHGQLSLARGWRDPPNEALARRLVPELLNPALGLPARVDGYGASHFVGVTGLGSDAADLDILDPRAGVFGATRRAKLADIGDGAANTIALLGVTKQIGPWAAGGAATTRPLTAAPYVNGPDGFGTGQGDGMFAAMADGSVRWISADADPRVIEQLATINGGETIELASLDPRHAPPPDEVKPADADTPDGPSDETKPDEGALAQPSEQPDNVLPARQPGVREVDVTARLADRVTAIDIPRVPLAKFLDFISRLTTIPCVLDVEALTAADQSARLEVTARLQDVSVEELLAQSLAEHDLVAHPIEVDVPRGGGPQHLLLVTRSDAGQLAERRLSAADLVPVADKSAPGDRSIPRLRSLAELQAALQRWIVPESWQPAGGKGTIAVDGNDLVIRQTPDMLAQISTLLERWRAARQAPADRLQPSDTPPGRRPWPAALDTPLTATFFDDARLADVLHHLAERSELTLLVDWRALASAGWGPDVMAGVRGRDLPLGEILTALLDPLGLDFRVIDEQTLEVTSREALARRPQVELYPLANLVTENRSLAAMLSELKKALTDEQGDNEREAAQPAGAPPREAELRYDEPSGYLIVAAPAGQQRAIARLLKSWSR